MNQTTILIVEDEPALLNALTIKFKNEGFATSEAHNGKEGLDHALSSHPSAILLDIVMPIMDGMTMLKKLREDNWGKDVPVLILTNLSDNKKIAEAMEQNTFDYLVKSNWTLDDVVNKVREKLTPIDQS
jgi:DNA-binding response OmpR family regulator